MLQGHAVTLTFKVADQMLHATRRLNMVIISVKLFRKLTLNNSTLWGLLERHGRVVGAPRARGEDAVLILHME